MSLWTLVSALFCRHVGRRKRTFLIRSLKVKELTVCNYNKVVFSVKVCQSMMNAFTGTRELIKSLKKSLTP